MMPRDSHKLNAVEREVGLGDELHVFRPLPRNVSAGYWTSTLMVGCGLGLVFEMLRRWWFGAPPIVLVLGSLVGTVLFFVGQRLLADIRTYDQLVLRVHQYGLEIETAQQLRRLRWSDIEQIDELTPLDPAVAAHVVATNPRAGDAVRLRRQDGWQFRLDRNRIADYHAMLETLRDMAEDHQIPWHCVHDLDGGPEPPR